MTWRDINLEPPPIGVMVLTYGFIAPDGKPRVLPDRPYVGLDKLVYFDRSDVVTRWAFFDDVPGPEEE